VSTIRNAFFLSVAASAIACSEPHDDVWIDDGQTSGFAPVADSGNQPDRDEEDEDVDPAELGDDFDHSELVGWEVFHNDAAGVVIEEGSLHIDPIENTEWGRTETSILVWKELDGDFMATASVRANGLEDPDAHPDAPPPPIFRFGGLLARNPDAEDENNLHIALGTDDDPSVETKNTVDGDSTWKGPPWPSASGEVRICRLGSSFLMYVREEDGDWELADAFARPDLPDVLAVGPMAYNDSPTADLRVSFDYVHFATIESQADCER
jgi:hypothetical protein